MTTSPVADFMNEAAPMSERQPDSRPIRFFSIPDKGEVRARISREGNPRAILPNILKLPSTLQAEFVQATRALIYPEAEHSARHAVPFIINYCLDADEYRKALIWLDEAYGSATPIFNHPRAVARSRRDYSSAALQGIGGLTVPRTARFRATSRAAFERCFAENAFSYPVLVRPRANQTGRGQLLIEGPQDWDLAVNTEWFGQPHFMTEFFDFASEDGLYLKARVVFVADRFFVRHIKAARGWKVHNETTRSITGFRDREMGLIRSLNEHAAFRRACAAIPARTGLDFCGMDVGVDPERGRFVMFECNAAMSVFFESGDESGADRQMRRDLLEAPAAIAFEQHLREPEKWVWRNNPLPDHQVSVKCRDLLGDEADSP